MAKRLQRRSSANGPKASDFWRTPPALYEALDAEFGFGIDLAANADDRLCWHWLGPGSEICEDAFAIDWWEAFRRADEATAGFLNPPYSSEQMKRWLPRVVEQIARMPGCVIVTLLPATCDTRWWRHTQHAVEIREIPHRVRYLKADGSTPAGAMFPSAIVVFRPQPGIRQGGPRRVSWTWRKEQTVKADAQQRTDEGAE